MLATSTVLLILSLTIDIRVIGNHSLAALSLGLMLISIGEWINHPLQERGGILPGVMSYTISNHNRLPGCLGIMFDIAGGVFVIIGAVAAYRFIGA